MTFNDYFKNEKLYKNLADEVNASHQLQSSFCSAIEQISSIPKYHDLLGIGSAFRSIGNRGTESAGLPSTVSIASSISPSYRQMQDFLVSPLQMAVVGKAIKDGYRFEGITEHLQTIYGSYSKLQVVLEETRNTIHDLLNIDTAFADRLKTSMYIKPSPVVEALSGVCGSFQGSYDAAKGIVDSITKAGGLPKSLVDTSWLREDSPWITGIKVFTEVNTDALNGARSSFTRLLNAEKETGKLLGLASHSTEITSAAAQIASIVQAESISSLRDWYGHSSISELLLGYNDFALNQHKEIQRALTTGRDRDAEWRVDLLDATSKFVDRQVIQKSRISEALEDVIESSVGIGDAEQEGPEPYQLIEKDYDNYEPIEKEDTDFFTIIPQSVGYSKREDSKVSPVEALETAKITTITELGFGIANRVLEINKLRQDMFQDYVFKPTGKNMWTMANLGQLVCDDCIKFETMIKSIYSLIYENQNGIKEMLGDGDAKVGDQIIRGKEYECMFRIKDLRTDLEHDIEHGKEKDQEKKRKAINEAYKFYAKKRPTTPKEFKQFQIKFYEDVINLIDRFIVVMNESINRIANASESDAESRAEDE